MDETLPENEMDKWLSAPSQRTLSDYIADQLRQAILADQLKPNQRMVEQEIAENMKTSRVQAGCVENFGKRRAGGATTPPGRICCRTKPG